MGNKLEQLKNQNKTKLSHSIGKKESLPIELKEISVSLFIFMLGWGLGGDTFFSVYVKSIVPTALGVTLMGSLLALIKLVVVLPVGIMNDKGSTRHLLLLGKILYFFSGFFYFLAGINGSIIRLLVAILFNGVANSCMHTSYRTLYGKGASQKNSSRVFGVYFSSVHLALVIGALISAFLVNYISLPHLYLFIVIFALLSILQDEKIQNFLRKKFSINWDTYVQKQTKSNQRVIEVDEGMQNVRNLFGKNGAIYLLSRELFSLSPWKKIFKLIKGYGTPMYTVLANQSLVSLLSYINFLFVPLVALQNNFNLSQIAILFAIMKSPYLVNIFIGSLGDKYSKKLITGVVLLFIAISFIFLGTVSSFTLIIFFSFVGALGVAILNPIAGALISGYAKDKDKGAMAALQEFMGKNGEIFGSLGFGVFSVIIGMKTTFILLGIGLGVLGVWIVGKKVIRIKTHDDEKFKERIAIEPFFKEK